MTIQYPVASDADAALKAPLAFAARLKDAAAAASAAVEFVSEPVGPTFATREALTEAFGGVLSHPYVLARPILASPKAIRPLRPSFEAGRRWPAAAGGSAPNWRLSISYWRIQGAQAEADLEAAREVRRRTDADNLSGRELQALARQPLRPIKPQKALDIGLFEVRPPEAPHILMPDE